MSNTRMGRSDKGSLETNEELRLVPEEVIVVGDPTNPTVFISNPHYTNYPANYEPDENLSAAANIANCSHAPTGFPRFIKSYTISGQTIYVSQYDGGATLYFPWIQDKASIGPSLKRKKGTYREYASVAGLELKLNKGQQINERILHKILDRINNHFAASATKVDYEGTEDIGANDDLSVIHGSKSPVNVRRKIIAVAITAALGLTALAVGRYVISSNVSQSSDSRGDAGK